MSLLERRGGQIVRVIVTSLTWGAWEEALHKERARYSKTLRQGPPFSFFLFPKLTSSVTIKQSGYFQFVKYNLNICVE